MTSSKKGKVLFGITTILAFASLGSSMGFAYHCGTASRQLEEFNTIKETLFQMDKLKRLDGGLSQEVEVAYDALQREYENLGVSEGVQQKLHDYQKNGDFAFYSLLGTGVSLAGMFCSAFYGNLYRNKEVLGRF